VTTAVTADLHFCPFTAPFFFDPSVPLVAIVHDLQFLEYPQFFDDEQRRNRHRHFLDACQRADRLICVSEFVRQTVLASGPPRPEAVQTIQSAVLHAADADPQAPSIAHGVLSRIGVRTSRFLLYPANTWPHKNHRRLLEAFGSYLRTQPAFDLALVCTGAPGEGAKELRQLGDALPPGTFAFAGYLAEPEFAALLRSCRALIFPSLYEGFGLPVLEAMASDRPVLCSNSTSLPEVAGDAAILFDPNDTAAIAQAIERLESDAQLETILIQRGRKRVAHFGSASDMAMRYLAAFEDVVSVRARLDRTAR
jgi:glycosyltransferase involved in cell wall biosynthesis